MRTIDKYCQEANEFLHEIQQELGFDDEQHTLNAVKSVFFTLRDSIHPGESMDFISQLPMVFKGLFVDQWKIGDNMGKGGKTLDQFLKQVNDNNERIERNRLGSDEEVKKVVQGVFSAIRKRASEGQIEHVKGQLPEEVRELFPA